MYSRRKFLVKTSQIFLASSTLRTPLVNSSDKRPASALGTLWYIKEVKGKVSQYSLVHYGLDNDTYYEIPIGFQAHSIVLNPQMTLAYVIAKWEYEAALIDLQQKKIVSKLHFTDKKRRFNGHGLFINNGKFLLSSEEISENADKKVKAAHPDHPGFRGILCLRDPLKNLNVIKDLTTYGQRPHHVMFFDQSKNEDTIIVSNDDKEQGSLAIIDLKSEKLLNKISISQFSPGHMALAFPYIISTGKWNDKKDISVSAAAVSLFNFEQLEKKYTFKVKYDKAFEHEVFWSNLNPQKTILAYIHSKDHTITFIDFKTGKTLHIYSSIGPRGISLSKNNKYFIVLEHERIRFFNTHNALEEQQMTRMAEISTGHPLLT